MSDNTPFERGTLEELRDAVEREKLQTTLVLCRAASEFASGFDREFNQELLRMMRAIASAMEADPGALFRSDASSLEEALGRLGEREQGGAADVAGGDWIDDVGRIVRIFTSVVTEEKEFFLTIIKLIFCGCDKI
jgi:hypothetical protein